MKLFIKKEVLEQSLNKVGKIISTNSHIKSLQGVRISTKPHVVTLQGTNIEMSIEVRIGGESDEERSFVVPVKTLSDVIKLLPQGEVVLDVNETTCAVVSKQGRVVLSLLPIDDFPPLPQTSSEVAFSIDKKALLQGFQSVLYSVSQSTIKPELASVSIYTDDTALVFVGTDSFRLAEKRIPVQFEDEFPSILIPSKNSLEIISFLSVAEDEKVMVSVDDDLLSIKTIQSYFTTRLTTGTFPDYKKILPKSFSTEVIVLKDDISVALKRAAVVSDTTKQIHIEIDPEEKLFTVSSQNSTMGEMTESIMGTVEGEKLSLNFNQRYLVDCFQSIPVDSVKLGFAGMGKPLVIQGISDKSFLYLVMPMNK
jgi:DNA polymerase III subunit beta